MSNLLESILRVAMTVFIVGPLTAWVARRGARERSEATDSLDCFTVRMPAAIRTIIACCAVAFELLMLGVYVWQGVSLGEWDHELVWFGHAMALAGMAIWALLSIPRIDVDGGRILSRNAFGIRKETTFGNITRATLHAQMMRIDLFEGDRKFCSISLEGCVLAQPPSPVWRKRASKSGRRRRSHDQGGPVLVCHQAVDDCFQRHGPRLLARPRLHGGLHRRGRAPARAHPVPVPVHRGFLPLLMLGMPARGIPEIGRQERALGFSLLRGDGKPRGATGTSLVDDDWFIEISNARVVAFRRDYLKKITAHENSERRPLHGDHEGWSQNQGVCKRQHARGPAHVVQTGCQGQKHTRPRGDALEATV